MMKHSILANDGIDEKGKSILENNGFEVIVEKVPQEALISYINNNRIDVLLVRSATKVRKPLIEACQNLKVIGRGGVGMDNIDVEIAREAGKEVINTPAASSGSVAELVMAHIFTASRYLHLSNREMPAEGAAHFATLKKKYSAGIELRGRTLGIIGFGRIGQTLARYAAGIGMRILPFDPFVEAADISLDFYTGDSCQIKIPVVPLEEVLKESDFLSLHVPGGEILGEAELGVMKPGAAIVNTSRGGVVNEKALIRALDSGHLSFAALDVFENEPTPDPALLNHPKISVSPHTGASTGEAQERIGVELAERIIAYFNSHQEA